MARPPSALWIYSLNITVKKSTRSQRKTPLRLGALPAVGRLCESKFFFLTKARSQPAIGRRKEIGENLRNLPEISRIGDFVCLARRGAKTQRKNPLRLGVLPAVGRLCALTSFFSHRQGASKVGRLGESPKD